MRLASLVDFALLTQRSFLAPRFARRHRLIAFSSQPDDYVLATGETHTVREFVEKSFAHVGIFIKWMGERGSVEETGVDSADESRVLVRIDPKYFRPTEVDLLLGDPSKAKLVLGWEAATKFEDLVADMMNADMEKVEKGDLIS